MSTSDKARETVQTVGERSMAAPKSEKSVFDAKTVVEYLQEVRTISGSCEIGMVSPDLAVRGDKCSSTTLAERVLKMFPKQNRPQTG